MRVFRDFRWLEGLLWAALGCAVAGYPAEVQLSSADGVTLGPDDTLEMVLTPAAGSSVESVGSAEVAAWVLAADAPAPAAGTQPSGRAQVWPSSTRPGEWLVHLRGLKAPSAGVARWDLLVRWKLPGGGPGEARLKGALVFRNALPDVVLLLDGSDSMGLNDPNRLRVEAARTFLVMAMRSGGIGRVGVIQFNSKVRTLLSLTPLAQTEAFGRALQEINESGMTDIEGSLRRALELLRQGDERNPAAVVLLTDGKQEPGNYLDAHKQLAAADIPVHTVALGKSADRVLLRRIAEDTGGTFSDAARDQELLRLYGAIASRIAGGRMIQASDLPAAGGEMVFPVDGSCRLLALNVSEPGTLDLTLPGGNALPGREEPHPAAYIATPEAGSWRARWRPAGGAGGARAEASAHTPLYPLFFRARLERMAPVEIDVDDPWLACSLAEGERPYGEADARVTATFGDAPPFEIPLFDDGQHGDGAAGDGVFGGPVPAMAGLKADLTGKLRMVVTGRRGAAGEPYRREVEAPCVLRRGGVRQLLTSGPIDLGERFSGETVAMEIPVRVRGAGGPLRVILQATEPHEAHLSRNCVVEKAPAELQPRRVETVCVQVRLPVGLEPGAYGGTVAFELGGGAQDDTLRARVPWRVRVKAPELTVQPTWLNLGSLKPGESRSTKLRVATRGGRALVEWGRGRSLLSSHWLGTVPPEDRWIWLRSGLSSRLEGPPPWDADGLVELRIVNWKELGEELEVTPEGIEVEVVATAKATATAGARVGMLHLRQPDTSTGCSLVVQAGVGLQWLKLDGQLQFGLLEAGDTKPVRLTWQSGEEGGAPEVPVSVRLTAADTPAVRVNWAGEDRGEGMLTLRTDRDAVAGPVSGWLELESATALARRAWSAQVVTPVLVATPPVLDLGEGLAGDTLKGEFSVSLDAVRMAEVDATLEDPPRKPAVTHIWMPNRTVVLSAPRLELSPGGTVRLPVEVNTPDAAQDGAYRLRLRLDSRLGRKTVDATFRIRSPVPLPLFHVAPTSLILKVTRSGAPTPAQLTIESHVDRDLTVRARIQPVKAGAAVCAELVPGDGQGVQELTFLLPARAELGLVTQGLSSARKDDECLIIFESEDEKQAIQVTVERLRSLDAGGLTKQARSRFDWFRILFLLLLLLLLMLILALTKRKWVRYTTYAVVTHAALMLVAVPASSMVNALPAAVQLTLIGTPPDEVVETSPEQARRIRDLPSVVAVKDQSQPKEADTLSNANAPELGALPKTQANEAPQAAADLAQASAPEARAQAELKSPERSAPPETADAALSFSAPASAPSPEPVRETPPDRAPAQARLTSAPALLSPPPPDAPKADYVPDARPVLQQASVEVERREVPLETFAAPTRVASATEDLPFAMESVQEKRAALSAVTPQKGVADLRAAPAVTTLAATHEQPVSFRVPAGGKADKLLPHAIANGTLDQVTGESWAARGTGTGAALTGSAGRGAGTPGVGHGDAPLDLGSVGGFTKGGQGVGQGPASPAGRLRPAGSGLPTATGVGSGGGPAVAGSGFGTQGSASVSGGGGTGATVGPWGGGEAAQGTRSGGGLQGLAQRGGTGGTGDAPFEFGSSGRSTGKTGDGTGPGREGKGTTGRAQPAGGFGLATGSGGGGAQLGGLGHGLDRLQTQGAGGGRSDLGARTDSAVLERATRSGAGRVASSRGLMGIRPLWGPSDSTTLKVTLGLARHGGDWNSSPTALLHLASAFRERCGLPALEVKVRQVSLSDLDAMKDCALVLVTSNEPVPWTAAEQDAARAYMSGGGFLWVNDSSATADERFDQSFQTALPKILPGLRLGRLDRDHPLFAAAYDLTRGYKGYPMPPGDKYREEFARGVRLGAGAQARLALLYTRNDYADGLEIDPRSIAGMKSLTDLAPDEMLEGSLRFGINALAYALGSKAPRMPPPPESAAEIAKMYRYQGPALPLFDDFEKDADAQGNALWNVDDWGNPADLSFVRAAKGRELSVRMKSGEKAKVGVSRLVELDLSEAKAVVLDLYSGLPEGFNAALLFSVKPDWAGYETRPVYIRPGWNRNLRFPLTLDDFKSAKNEWKEYNSAFQPRKEVARISVLLYNLHVDGEVRIDNLRIER